MYFSKITYPDINNGPGFRVSLWVSGCSIHCKGCHNKALWNFSEGRRFVTTDLDNLVECCNISYIDGFTLLGGEPFDQSPRDITTILKTVKEQTGKSIWAYSGHEFKDLYNKKWLKTLQYIDVLVAGPYVEELRDVSLAFRGSSNQQLIDIQKTLKTNNVVYFEVDSDTIL